MSDIFQIALLAGLFSALPWLLLFIYRRTIPPGAMWAALICSLSMPVLGAFVALYVALKDWD